MAINRFEVYLVNLDPTIGSEIRRLAPVWLFRRTKSITTSGR